MAIKKQTFAKGVLIVMVSQVVIKLMGFIYRVILTNIEGFQDEGNSYYGTGYKVYTFVLALCTTGVSSAIAKLVSEKIAVGDNRGAHKLFKTALAIFCIVGVAFGALLFFCAEYIANVILSNPCTAGTMKTLAPAVFFVAIASVFRGYFVGLSNMTAHSKAQIIEQFVNAVLSVVFVLMLIGNTPEIMAMGSTAATTVSTLVALIYLIMYYQKNKREIWLSIRKSKRYGDENTKAALKKILSYVLPLSFASVAVSLAGMVDLLTVVEALQKYGYSLTKANEIFGVVLGKVDILVGIPHTFNVAIVMPLIPAIATHMVRKEHSSAENKINFSMKLSSIIAFPCIAGLTILAEPIFQVLFPNAVDGAILMQIEVWAVAFSLYAQTAEAALTGIGHLYIPGIAVIVSGITKYLLNITLIPMYGENMIGVTTICYHLINAIITVIALYYFLRSKPDIKNVIFKPILATIIMSVCVILVQKTCVYINVGLTTSTVLAIVIGMLTYFYSLLKTKLLTNEEINQIPYGNKIAKWLKIN